jgi:hypothetical protein
MVAGAFRSLFNFEKKTDDVIKNVLRWQFDVMLNLDLGKGDSWHSYKNVRGYLFKIKI